MPYGFEVRIVLKSLGKNREQNLSKSTKTQKIISILPPIDLTILTGCYLPFWQNYGNVSRTVGN